ncbi:MAG: anthranilate synthase component I family protein [Candidatus Margulisbacteria bacterium]|nr:anthranilate synthase component I family protein [Candidatus Margulisiibacteriota bacterium]MBU1021839.1 anthranilate synthase component I family protein [Candidatus Margulisiibacteriota bacterium]MBU1728998.1 anthranilate synthase component I family protein [Candidatus Margulisiibacteriota bacterium]MBU1954449.1 anthranilate synthase component I family protein [Candidatus Margulisiibacteriota bacterium]
MNNLSSMKTFEKIHNEFGSFILDSANNIGQSFIGWDPLFVISAGPNDNPFDILKEQFNKHKNHPEFKGIFGYISYDAAWHLEKLPHYAKDDLNLPIIYFIAPRKLEIILHDATEPSRLSSSRKENNLKSNLSKAEFENIVIKAKQYIKDGDIYQANLSQRLEFDTKDPPLEIYKRLREINPSPFASYFNFGDFQIVSCSPERLIKLENGLAQTRPIAGTRPASATDNELLLNPKERAEHIMLVDLERNDLGRVCEYGSVKVNEQMIIEKYSHVIHIVSNVIGKLSKDKDQFDLIQAMFPGGTITGCPKIRSMEIIEELEPVKRGIYTGSIGYILPDGTMDFNIIIRTILMKDKKAYIQVGAGIVADSDPEKEYYETLHKAGAMVEALNE